MAIPVDELKNRLKKALSVRNLKPVDLVEKTNIPKSAISQYMSGYAKPKQDRVYLIAKALDIDEGWLMGYNVPMERRSDATKSELTTILDDKETQLITLYKKLNSKGQDILLETADTLVCSEKYKKRDTVQTQKEA